MSKAYYVTYSITREETYRVEADNEKDAFRDAFSEGVFIETGETTNVTDLECRVARHEKARLVKA